MAFEFMNEDDEGPEDQASHPSQPYQAGTQDWFRKNASDMGMRPEQPAAPDDRAKYVKAKATIDDAYGTAEQALTRNPAGAYPTGETRPFPVPKNVADAEDGVDTTLQRVQNREHPLKIADDMRALAGQFPFAPKYQEMLHDGADKMNDAYQAQGTIDQMQQPGGALALNDEVENRYGQAQAATGDLDRQIAQKQDELKTAGYIRQPQIQQQLQQLQNQKKQALQTVQAGGELNQPIDKKLNMNAVLTAAGWDRQDFIQANTEVRRMVGMHGINPTDPVTPSTFPVIVPKIVEEAFNPQVAAKFFAEINERPEQDRADEEDEKAAPAQKRMPGAPSDKTQPVVDQGLQDVTNRLRQSQMRHDAVWKELAHSGNFNNVGDVIGFVLTSVVLGPRAGAMLFSNMQKNGGLRNELDMVDHETTQLFHQQNSYIQLSQHARQQALSEEHQKDQIQQQDFNLQETERHHKAMEGYMGMKTANKAGWTPDEQATDRALQHGVRQKEGDLQAQESKVKSLEKIANNPMDPQFKTARTQVASERAKLQQMQTDHANVMIKVRQWYLDHGGKDIFPKQPQARGSGSGVSLQDEE